MSFSNFHWSQLFLACTGRSEALTKPTFALFRAGQYIHNGLYLDRKGMLNDKNYFYGQYFFSEPK